MLHFGTERTTSTAVEHWSPRKVKQWASEAVVIPPGEAGSIKVNTDMIYKYDVFVDLSLENLICGVRRVGDN
jgi:hypothetical protein